MLGTTFKSCEDEKDFFQKFLEWKLFYYIYIKKIRLIKFDNGRLKFVEEDILYFSKYFAPYIKNIYNFQTLNPYKFNI